MKMDLNVAWEILNQVCFEGELIRPRIFAYHTLIESPSEKNARTYLMGAYQHGYCGDRNEILIWSKQPHPHKLETLYHEMVHQYLHEVLDEHNAGHSALYTDIYWEGIRRLINAHKKSKRRIQMGRSRPHLPHQSRS